MDDKPWYINPYATTFFENVSSREEASLLNLNGIDPINEIEIKVSKTFKTYQIICKLIDENGTPFCSSFTISRNGCSAMPYSSRSAPLSNRMEGFNLSDQ